MDVRSLIRTVISEELGNMRFPTGALTPQAHGLILFAQQDTGTYQFSLEHGSDKMAVYRYALAAYEKRFNEPLSGDEETVMYDFLAHYQKPGPLSAAENMFANALGDKIHFKDALGNTKFTILVDRDFVIHAQAMAHDAGYVANIDGTHDRTAPQVTMKVVKNPGREMPGSDL